MFRTIDIAKTHEIMSRFRPIAPKPPPPLECPSNPSPAAGAALHLRPRPCRARKRSRTTIPTTKRHKPTSSFLSSSPIFTRPDLLTLSLLPFSPPPERALTPPVEIDLLQKLQEPKLITPQPVRPVGSNISVDSISLSSNRQSPVIKKPEEVEEEVESEALPAVISDSNNRVRLANSAYKEMVGQPECPWLDSMVLIPRGGAGQRRINGEVMLDLSETWAIPAASNGFSCRVKIEWACNGRKSFVDAPCDVMRLYCDSKDYLFTWRFHTKV